jgi:RNA polymerase sigma-70 factor (ECF subfamily)
MAPAAIKPIDPYPDARYGFPGSVALALVAALHRLEPRERAAVALAEVEGFAVADVAMMLGTSEDWVERTLLRAASGLPATPSPAGDLHAELQLVGRFAAALEAIDPARVAELLAPDAALGCTRRWAVYRGRRRVAAILCDRMADERLRLVATRANGQPAFGCYVAEPGAASAPARGLLAFSIANGLVTSLTRFWDNDVLPYFGLPAALSGPPACTADTRASGDRRR